MNEELKLKLKKLAVGAVLAATGALLTYAIEAIPNVGLGEWTPAVVAVLSVAANALRKFGGPVAGACLTKLKG